MDAETDIQVYFTEIEQYTFTVDNPKHADMTIKNGDKDFVSGKTVRYGDEIIVTVKPNENYRLADAASWIDNGDGSYTYKTGAIKADTNISVKIEEIPEYTVTFPTTIDGCILSVKNDKGKISSGDKLREGTRLTATVTLDPTFILKGWYIGGELLSETNKNEITFTVDSDILLTVIVTDVKGDTGDQGDQGDKGDTGATGVGVKSVTIDEDGNLIITLTDDTVHNAGKVTGDKGEQGNQGDKGDKGDKGDTGIGVKSVAIDDDGNLIITLTDDTVHNAGKVNASNGENGRNGADGVGIENAVVDENGNLIITLSNGTVHNLGKVTGEKGDAGKDGQDGSNGNGIQSAEIDADGNLIITFTDGVVTNLGKIVGTDGKNGTDGKDGKDGVDGKNGIGIKGCRIDDNGNLILTLTDNTTLDAGNISAISDNVNVSKPLATAAVSVAGTSLLWNVVSVAISIIRKKKLV